MSTLQRRLAKLIHIPTWALAFLALAAAGAVVTDLVMLFTLDSVPSLTINGIDYLEDSPEYAEGMHNLRRSLLFSLVLAALVGSLAARTIWRRKHPQPPK